MVNKVTSPLKTKFIFTPWQESMLWSCLQGVMGTIYTDNPDNPKSAMAVLGDFCFFAGEPNIELVSYRQAWTNPDFIIMTAKEPSWNDMIEQVYGEHAKKVTRYAIKKEPDVFDEEKLQAIVNNLDPEFELRLIDKSLYEKCLSESWSRDMVSLYFDYEQYRELGLGVVALEGQKIVSGASSYSSYRGGIEVEVDTHRDYRRRGLAAACSAKLILECRRRGWYPSWDAQNLWSVALAEKLGYHLDHEYTAYEVSAG